MMAYYPNQVYFPKEQNPVKVNEDGSSIYDETNHPINLLFGKSALDILTIELLKVQKESPLPIIGTPVMTTAVEFAAEDAEKQLKAELDEPYESVRSIVRESVRKAVSHHYQCNGEGVV